LLRHTGLAHERSQYQLPAMERQFSQRLGLDLANALARYSEALPHIFKRQCVIVSQAKTQ